MAGSGVVKRVDYNCLMDFMRWLFRQRLIPEGLNFNKVIEAYQDKMRREGQEKW